MTLPDGTLNAPNLLFQEYLEGKDGLFMKFSRLLSPLLSINICSFIWEKYFFKYQWMDITDYRVVLDFFLKGNFIIPLSLFIIVHFTTGVFASLIVTTMTEGVIKLLIRSKLKMRKSKISPNQKPFFDFLEFNRKFDQNKENFDYAFKNKDIGATLLRLMVRVAFIFIIYDNNFSSYPTLHSAAITLLVIFFIIVWFFVLFVEAVEMVIEDIKKAEAASIKL